MKKKIIITLIIGSIILSYIALPIGVEAETIKQFEAEVKDYTAQLEAKKAKIVTNDQEVAKIKAKIEDIKNQITQAETDIENLQNEIEKSNQEIKEKSEESKKIIEYYQVSNGDNAYLEYAFGASDITDMIYRMSVVEQLTEYNDKIMKELKQLIEENKQKQAQLATKRKDLLDLQDNLKSEEEKINADSAAIRETMPSLEEQIKSAQANLNYLKSIGCGDNEEKNACIYRYNQAHNNNSSGGGGSVPSTNGFYRPIEYGSISQGFSWNNNSGSGSHMGVDIISSNRSIAIYPIATGQVFAKFYDSAGALVVKIRHNYNGMYIYSTYAHMRSFGPISVGQNVTTDTLLGYMGSTGNSTGPHLHLEITTCDWHAGGGCTWWQYQHNVLNPFKYVELPWSWSNR